MVRFASFDGTVIPSAYYRPKNASPALVWVHGGPGGQAMRCYGAQIQYLVNHGYAVLAVNNRGSSGFGKTFFNADDRRHGREPLWDCIEAKTFLASLGHIDPQLIGIAGGSYGGYMVLAAMAFRPEAFKVGVDFFRRQQLDPHVVKHSAVLGGAAPGAVRRDRRSSGRPRDADRDIAAVSCAGNSPAAVGGARRQ